MGPLTGANRTLPRAAGTGWLSWSTQRVPNPSHRRPVVHAERVHRDRSERGMAGHERVANEREHSAAKNA